MSEGVYPPIYRITVFNFPRRVLFGLEAADKIGEEVKAVGGRKVLVVTDPTMVKLGYLSKIKDLLEKENFEIEAYDKVEADPHIETAEAVAELARKGKFDVIVGLGGGSSMDMAKVASVAIRNPGPIKNYTGDEQVEKRGPPIICLPTTSGTGSEVTPYAVFSEEGKKRAIASHNIIPDIALVDPLFTVSMPPRITAGSGMDALSHAVESMLSLWSTPTTDALALEAIRIISRNLRTAYYNGRDIEARCYMALAATTSGLAFSGPRVVYGHSIAQTFAPLHDVPHGVSCGMTLPYVMDFYVPAVPTKLAAIAQAMGNPTRGLTAREAAEKAVRSVYELAQDLDIPSLQDVGVSQGELPSLAEACIRDWPRPNTPRKLTEKTALQIFKKMWKGEI